MFVWTLKIENATLQGSCSKTANRYARYIWCKSGDKLVRCTTIAIFITAPWYCDKLVLNVYFRDENIWYIQSAKKSCRKLFIKCTIKQITQWQHIYCTSNRICLSNPSNVPLSISYAIFMLKTTLILLFVVNIRHFATWEHQNRIKRNETMHSAYEVKPQFKSIMPSEKKSQSTHAIV